MSFRSALTVFSVTAMLCEVGVGLAQQRNPANNRAVEQRPAGQVVQQAQGQGNDQLLSTCVAIDNQAEINLAEFAQSKAQDEQVKEFAQMLVKDHQQFQQKLQQFAPSAGQIRLEEGQQTSTRSSGVQQAAGTATADSGIRQTAGTQATGQPQLRPQAGTQAGIDPIQLHRELAAQCLADTKKMLSEKEEGKFDVCFVGQQIAMHGATISKLKVLKRHASGELAQVLGEGLETSERHMEKAEKLMKELDDSDDSDNSQKQTRKERDQK